MDYGRLSPPIGGRKIDFINGELIVPNDPIIPFIEGDGTGVDITPAMRLVVDGAVAKAYGGERRIHWWNIPAGEKAYKELGEWLPKETIEAIREYRVAIKGPMTTPVGGGIRSLNVALRQELDLFACVRPVRWFEGVPSPVKNQQDLDVVIFRENTEDTYLGIEFRAGSDEARRFIELVRDTHGKVLRPDSGIGIKPMSQGATERIAETAIRHALAKNLPSITIVHKGNIMKYTEGAFRDWVYAYYKKNYRDRIVTEAEQWEGHPTEGRLLIKDRIADAMFQQILLRPKEYSAIVTSNLNGDYLSDACAAQVGGLGMAPGANTSIGMGLFEATHGTAPKYAGLDMVNPSSLLLSAAMMLEFMSWDEAARLIYDGIATTISQKRVTYDLERQMQGATLLKCSEFAAAIVENL